MSELQKVIITLEEKIDGTLGFSFKFKIPVSNDSTGSANGFAAGILKFIKENIEDDEAPRMEIK